MDTTRGAEGAAVARRPRDRGYSLVEVAVTITLMAIVIVPLLMATFTLIKASSTARFSSEGQRVITDAADRVTRADPGCNYSTAVQAAALSRGWDAGSIVATYQYFEPGIDALPPGGVWVPSSPGAAESAACPGGQHTPRLIQLVTITVTDESGNSRTIQVVKSDV